LKGTKKRVTSNEKIGIDELLCYVAFTLGYFKWPRRYSKSSCSYKSNQNAAVGQSQSLVEVA